MLSKMYKNVDEFNDERLFNAILKKYDELNVSRAECDLMMVERSIPITFEMFFNIIELAKNYKSYVFRLYEDYNFGIYEYPSASGVNQILSALELALFDRENKYISYFIYDLEFGKKYKDGMIIVDGVEYHLTSAFDLWALLLKNIQTKIINSERSL